MSNVLEERMIKIRTMGCPVPLKVVPGHFATNHSHINYYIDMTTLKTRHNEAKAIAQNFATKYSAIDVVDTIVCMDGCEVIGSYLAEALTDLGVMSVNLHKSIYVVSPEYNGAGQMIFRDNIQPMIQGKNILLILASAATGKTVNQCVECLDYYGGKLTGIAAIFSAVEEVGNYRVDSIFKKEDLPEYHTYKYTECPFCKNGHKIEALVNSFGYSVL